MGVVSFRLPDDEERWLRSKGVSPGARAKELLEADIRRATLEDDLAFFEKHKVKSRVPAARLIRQIRDER